MRTVITAIAAGALLTAAGAATASAHSADVSKLHTYQVTISNLTGGEPLSPGMVATTAGSTTVHAFTPGTRAGRELAYLAQDGMEAPLVELFKAAATTTDVVDVAQPLIPRSVTKTGLSSSLTVTIKARPGDRLSVASMLVCSNDGFTGLREAPLPSSGSTATYLLPAFDAGVENNTEASADLPDPCSAVGPAPLAGDPNGNDDAGPATVPQGTIAPHPGITGAADLDAS